MTAPTLSTVDAAASAGVTVRQLQHWAKAGYLKPTPGKGAGRGGTSLRWDANECDMAEMLGVVSRQLGRPDLLGVVSKTLRDGTAFTLPDGDFEVVVSLRARTDIGPRVGEPCGGHPRGYADA